MCVCVSVGGGRVFGGPCLMCVSCRVAGCALRLVFVLNALILRCWHTVCRRRTIALYSATIVTCCCTPEHIKRWFVDARGIEAMFAMLARLDDPASTAVVLEAVATLTDGPGAALCCASMTTLRVPMPKATRPGFSAESGTIAHFLFRLVHHQDTRIRILASRWWAHHTVFCRARSLHRARRAAPKCMMTDLMSPGSAPKPDSYRMSESCGGGGLTSLTNVYREHPESLAEDGSPERVLEAVLKLLQVRHRPRVPFPPLRPQHKSLAHSRTVREPLV